MKNFTIDKSIRFTEIQTIINNETAQRKPNKETQKTDILEGKINALGFEIIKEIVECIEQLKDDARIQRVDNIYFENWNKPTEKNIKKKFLKISDFVKKIAKEELKQERKYNISVKND